MNETVAGFIRKEIKVGLHQLPETCQSLFVKMYSHDDLSRTIDEVVDRMPEGKLDWALSQVENSLKEQKADHV